MVWLKQLKDAVSEADDALDEIHYEMLRRAVKNRDRLARNIPSIPSLKKLSFRREMGHKIDNINKRLSQINKRANGLGLQNEQPGPAAPYHLYRETVPYLDEFKFVGREDDEQRIIDLLTESRKEEKLKIVPIVGMGGMGKTTLAKSVYNNPKIQQHFDVKAWMCLLVKVDINTLLAKIYESLAEEECKSRTMANLITNLEKKLDSKRYLLVLDDVWDKERSYWEEFRNVMLNMKSRIGSGILVTTRKLDIGTKAMRMNSCSLKGLSDDHCWYIFKERAFLAGQSPPPELEKIGRDIVERCCGFPLLVKVIGGMLQNYSDKEKWLSIKNSRVWDLEEERDGVERTLKLSFDNLPSSVVKQCFAYCSKFQKDTFMEREEVIQLWMALGLVQADESRNKEMEDVGNDIFQTLIRNSLFQDVERDEYGYVTGCRMHDLVHDLFSSLSKHEGLRLVDAINKDVARIPQVIHIAFYHNEINDSEFKSKLSMLIEKDMAARTLHTLFFSGEVDRNASFQRFKCMRILKLKWCRIEKIDDSIGELVHLRYLDLSDNGIIVLPESIGKLYHLQTLKMRNCYHFEFQKGMKNLISLRYFKSYKGIPANIVGQLTSLRTLPYFKVNRKKGHRTEELHGLKHLSGDLQISHLEEISSKEEAAKADLSGKKILHGIDFRWSKDRGANANDRDVLEVLQPPRDLKSLKVRNYYGDNFPAWVMKMAIDIEGNWKPLDKLVEIKLSRCSSCHSLPILEYLPLLKDLMLENLDNLRCLRSSLS